LSSKARLLATSFLQPQLTRAGVKSSPLQTNLPINSVWSLGLSCLEEAGEEDI